MSNSISLPFLIIATGTILFVYMSVVIMELRSAYFKTSKENKGHE